MIQKAIRPLTRKGPFLKANQPLKMLALLFCFPLVLLSQTYTLTGKLYNSETQEALAFGTIFNADGYAISNEDGAFELRLKGSPKWIKVHYIGFKPDSISIAPGTKKLDVYLVPQANVLNEVVVKARSGDYRYRLLFKAIESYFENGLKEVNCKSYYRTYTLLNHNQPAELFEAFYNQTCNAQEIKNLKLKGGRFLLPRRKTFVNFASTVLIEMFKPFVDGQTVFPFSPLQCATLLQLKHNYNVVVKNIIKSDNDTLYQLAFTPTDTLNSFGGELFYYKRANRVGKLKLTARNVTVHPLYSMRDSVKDKISALNYVIEIGYAMHHQKNLVSYVNYDMTFNLKTGKKTDLVSTNMKMVNFDYDKSFTLPIYPKIDFKFDYEKVAAFPYNACLFDNNVFIKEAGKELYVRRLFDSVRCYNSISLDESLLFLQKRYQRWHTGWQPDEDLVTSAFMPEAHTRYGNNYSKSKKAAWDSLFAFTFIFLDYDCYKDSAVFTSNAMMDYKHSFLMNPHDTLSAGYFKMYLDNCKVTSNQLLRSLQKKYRGRCPTELEVQEDYNRFSAANTASAYFIHTTANSPGKAGAYNGLFTNIKVDTDNSVQSQCANEFTMIH